MQTQIDFSVHINSITNYREKILPTISGRKKEVLDAIKALGGTTTLYEIGQYLNKSLNVFSGRISELKKMDLIEDTKENKIINDRAFSILKLKTT